MAIAEKVLCGAQFNADHQDAYADTKCCTLYQGHSGAHRYRANKVKHTSGPWETRTMGRGNVRIGAVGYNNYVDTQNYLGGPLFICEDRTDDAEFQVNKGQSQANARLISAAPELAEALTLCHRLLLQQDPVQVEYDREVINMAWAALTKAGLA